jgi:hypothetical protein
LRRICGWERTSEVPDETVFSRAFAEFARTELPQRVHQALIRKTQQERLIGHISRDATAIAARERVAKVENAPAKKQLKVRRQRGTPRQPEEMTRIERQKTMTLAEMLGGPPHGLRRRLQDEQSRAQRDLARLPAASGCSRRTNPDQLRADVGESARQPSGDPAGYHNRGAGQQLVRPDGFGV